MYTMQSSIAKIAVSIAVAVLCPTLVHAQAPKPPTQLSIDSEAPPTSSADLQFNDGFEGTVPTEGATGHPLYRVVSDGSGVVAKSTTHRREGSSSLRAQLTKDGTANFRQELRVRSPTDNQPMGGSGDYWYGESVYVPSGSSLASNSVITQWHTNNPTSGHSPVLGMRIINGNWTVTRSATDSADVDSVGPVATNQWTDWVYQVRWRPDNTGLIRVWMNGKLVYERTNVQSAWDGEADQPYLLVGRYTSAWKQSSNSDPNGTSHESWHDALRICQGAKCVYGDVAPVGDRLKAP